MVLLVVVVKQWERSWFSDWLVISCLDTNIIMIMEQHIARKSLNEIFLLTNE